MQNYQFFNTTELKPTGWLRRQLEIQADGLSGHLDKVWPDIRDSRWIGGNREGWERVPYWLDGFIPLAYLLDDEDKIARAKKYVDAIIAGQCEDGWLCPCTVEERAGYDMWALYLIDKVLMLYYDCSGDERIPGVVYRSLKNLKSHIEAHPIFAWAHSRWFECLIPIFRLYEIYPEEWLLDLARLLRTQGMNYEKLYENWPYQEPLNEWRQESHVVNQAMAIKEGGLVSLLDGEPDDSFSEFMLSQLFAFHGTAAGHFTGDECLSGDSPVQGTELCSVVEAMYSYEVLYALTGHPVWADRLEKLAYNALPATITPDMWAHQYDQMTNQVACVRLEPGKVIFRTNGPESHLFGLEPNFGCCTANFNQGWPKFAMSVFLKSKDGITTSALAPAKLTTVLDGCSVTVESETLYPFGDTVNYIVTVAGENECDFTLTLRIPACAASAKIDGEDAEPGTLVLLKRKWSGTSVVRLEMTFAVKYVARPHDMFAIERGPLVYSLAIGEEWNRLEYIRDNVERRFPYCDWEIRPTTDWQYAFAKGDIIVHDTGTISDLPFSTELPPVTLEVPMVPIQWGYMEGYRMIANAVPSSIQPEGEVCMMKFIPYGSTTLRVTEIPFAAE
ncbi:MAG: beta-L-arabinofuranosidase domain-containing protein [Eubacteriales bacterium]